MNYRAFSNERHLHLHTDSQCNWYHLSDKCDEKSEEECTAVEAVVLMQINNESVHSVSVMDTTVCVRERERQVISLIASVVIVSHLSVSCVTSVRQKNKMVSTSM